MPTAVANGPNTLALPTTLAAFLTPSPPILPAPKIAAPAPPAKIDLMPLPLFLLPLRSLSLPFPLPPPKRPKPRPILPNSEPSLPGILFRISPSVSSFCLLCLACSFGNGSLRFKLLYLENENLPALKAALPATPPILPVFMAILKIGDAMSFTSFAEAINGSMFWAPP